MRLTLFVAAAALASACSTAPTPPPKAPLPSTSGSGERVADPGPLAAEAAPEATAPDESQRMPTGPTAEFLADEARLQAEREQRARDARLPALEAVPARTLQGSRWWPVSDGAVFREIVFLESLLGFTTVDGDVVVVPADYSGNHPLCSGYPTCVVTAQADGTPQVFLFGRQGEHLFSVECISALGMERAAFDEVARPVREQHGALIVYDDGPALCWNAAGVPFRSVPLWWTEADEARLRADQAAAANERRDP